MTGRVDPDYASIEGFGAVYLHWQSWRLKDFRDGIIYSHHSYEKQLSCSACKIH
jgi:hypothetical protein